MIGAAMVKNIRRTGIPASKHGKPNPEYPGGAIYDRRSADTLAAGQYAPIDVDDPLEPGAKLTVLRQLRNDPLARLHDRRQIDEAQYQAGRAYQQAWERTECGARAIDPTKEKVDGGVGADPVPEGRQEAALRLAGANRKLGLDGSALMFDLLIQGLSLEDVLSRRGLKGQWHSRLFGKKFRDGLNLLARHWGFSNGERDGRDSGDRDTEGGLPPR